MSTEVAEKVEVTSYEDSEGVELEVGSRVYVSDAAVWENVTWENHQANGKRTFDFGEVGSLNDDGSVNVLWDAAACSCSAEYSEDGRVEKASDLTVTTENEISLYYKGVNDGGEQGRNEVASELKSLLGL